MTPLKARIAQAKERHGNHNPAPMSARVALLLASCEKDVEEFLQHVDARAHDARYLADQLSRAVELLEEWHGSKCDDDPCSSECISVRAFLKGAP